MTTSSYAPIANLRRKQAACHARRDRIRRLEEMGAWAQLIAGFVAALAILMPVAIMIGYDITWRWFV